MATPTVLVPRSNSSRPDGGDKRPPLAFRPGCEAFEVFAEEAPALVINPDASTYAILAAVKSRTRRLVKQLNMAARIDSQEITGAEVADPLCGLAEEILLLLDAIDAKTLRD